jgi:LPXTG-site transpeptidase (sortase) family protein
MIFSLMDSIWERKYVFIGTFFLVFLFSYLALVAIDFVPEPKTESAPIENTNIEEEALIEYTAEADFELPVGSINEPLLPTTMYIKKFDRKITVLNPTSRSIPDLDAALLSGVVRHPDSADLAQDGNVFILGHSSYLPNVMNKSFQAFNGIQELQWGDVIELTANGYVMTYEVEKVYKARAQDVTVPIAGTGPRLTLATCNSFGSTDDRYIVEAKRVSIKAL